MEILHGKFRKLDGSIGTEYKLKEKIMPDVTITLKDVPEVDRVEKIELPEVKAMGKEYAYVLFLNAFLNEDIMDNIKKQWDAYLGPMAPKLLILDKNSDLKRL